MNILITGFMPFGGHDTNVTKILLDNFKYENQNHMIHKVIFSTTFDTLRSELMNALVTYNPDLLIHLGEHARADAITLERVAINFDDARIPDNAGIQPIDLPIVDNGVSAYFSHLPLRSIESALKDKNIPVKISYSAGAFVCNHLFYVSEDIQSQRKNRIPSGFIHIPLIKEQDERALFDLETIKHALTVIIDTCIKASSKS